MIFDKINVQFRMYVCYSGSAAGVQSCGCGAATCSAPGVAEYRVTFTATWRQPPPPPSAHWSSLVGGSHSPCAVIWRNNTLATAGVKAVAEVGTTGIIYNEMSALGSHLGQRFRGRSIWPGTGTSMVTVRVDRHRPLISALSMIAPSPDWIVGVDSVSMCNGDEWLQRASYDLYLWDAGTDSGLEFRSPNQVTRPQARIARITESTTDLSRSMAGVSTPLGRLDFERIALDRTGTLGDSPSCSPCGVKPCSPSTDACKRSGYSIITCSWLEVEHDLSEEAQSSFCVSRHKQQNNQPFICRDMSEKM